jgi:hypothetical protein
VPSSPFWCARVSRFIRPRTASIVTQKSSMASGTVKRRLVCELWASVPRSPTSHGKRDDLALSSLPARDEPRASEQTQGRARQHQSPPRAITNQTRPTKLPI